MNNIILKNISLFGEITDIEITEGKITSVGKNSADGNDFAGMKVYPSLFDIHAHGVIGHDTMDADAVREMSDDMFAHGTGAWCPTTMTMDFESIKRATDEIPDGCMADVIGYHLEGPYLNAQYKGAMNEKFLRKGNIEEFEKFKNVAMITVAPEIEGNIEFIKNCPAKVCIGHTACSYDKAIEAIESGAVCLTHTFNAMSPIHHRDPGPIGAAADRKIYAQVISDGIHLHPSAVRMLYSLFGSDRMILISDAMKATGLPDGEYEFGGQLMTVKDKIARTPNGNLAGSTSYLYDCVLKAIEFGIPEKEAFKMASETPFNMLGIKRGKIEAGYPADLIIADDAMNIKYMVKNGEIIKI